MHYKGEMDLVSTNLNCCKECGKSFSRKFHLEQHKNIHTKEKVYKCEKCEKSFNVKSNLMRHMKTHDVALTEVKCNICSKIFNRKGYLERHMKTHDVTEVEMKCDICQKIFNHKAKLNRHMKRHDKVRIELKCDICQKVFNHEGNLNRHMKTHEDILCKLCKKKFARKENLNHHLKVKACIRKKEYEAEKLKNLEWGDEQSKKKGERNNEEGEVRKTRKNSKSALGVFTVDEIFPSSEAGYDLNVFLSEITPKVKSILEEELKIKRGVKWYMNVNVVMTRTSGYESENGDEGGEIITPHFRSQVYTNLTEDFLEDSINDGKVKIVNSFEEFTQRGSGWTILKIMKLDVFVAKYRPLGN